MKTRTGANRIVRLGSFARAGALAAALGVASCGADADWSAGDEELGAIEEELVGGTLTSERPAIGMFAFRGSTLCSATLVEPSYVATAAHCVDSFSGPDWGEFLVGDSVANITARFDYDRVYSFRNPSWGRGFAMPTDFAIVHLTEPVPADVVTPIGFGPAPQNGQTVTAFGFGCNDHSTFGGTWFKRYFEYSFGSTTNANCPGDSGGPRVLGRHNETGTVWAVNSGLGDVLAPASESGPDGLRGIKAFGITSATQAPLASFPSWARASGVKAVSGDFNADGVADIALVGGSGWNSIRVAFGRGNGRGEFDVTTRRVEEFPSWARAARNAVAGDFDGDGDTDIALLGGSNWTTIPIAFSNRDGTFTVTNLATPDIPVLARASGAYAVGGDFDGDGDGDIALLGGAGWTTIPVAFSDRNGRFTRTNSAVAQFPALSRTAGARAAVGDFDGDGDADIALSGAPSWTTVPVAWSSRSGAFTTNNTTVARFPSWAASANALVAGDYDGDGDSDLIAVGWDTDRTLVGFAVSSGRIGRFQPAQLPMPSLAALSSDARFVLPGKVDWGSTSDLILAGGSSWDSIPTATFEPMP